MSTPMHILEDRVNQAFDESGALTPEAIRTIRRAMKRYNGHAIRAAGECRHIERTVMKPPPHDRGRGDAGHPCPWSNP